MFLRWIFSASQDAVIKRRTVCERLSRPSPQSVNAVASRSAGHCDKRGRTLVAHAKYGREIAIKFTCKKRKKLEAEVRFSLLFVYSLIGLVKTSAALREASPKRNFCEKSNIAVRRVVRPCLGHYDFHYTSKLYKFTCTLLVYMHHTKLLV